MERQENSEKRDTSRGDLRVTDDRGTLRAGPADPARQLPDLLTAAAALLARLDAITADEFSKGRDRAEREALRAAIIRTRRMHHPPDEARQRVQERPRRETK
jgi:hypothetical protein